MAEIDISKYSESFLRKLLKDMLLIRRVEEKCGQMYGLRKIGGFCHLYIGQEAVAVGSIATLDLNKDYVLTAYRDHGHALACGMGSQRFAGRAIWQKRRLLAGQGRLDASVRCQQGVIWR